MYLTQILKGFIVLCLLFVGLNLMIDNLFVGGMFIYLTMYRFFYN